MPYILQQQQESGEFVCIAILHDVIPPITVYAHCAKIAGSISSPRQRKCVDITGYSHCIFSPSQYTCVAVVGDVIFQPSYLRNYGYCIFQSQHTCVAMYMYGDIIGQPLYLHCYMYGRLVFTCQPILSEPPPRSIVVRASARGAGGRGSCVTPKT